jgi:hypothetical protein
VEIKEACNVNQTWEVTSRKEGIQLHECSLS